MKFPHVRNSLIGIYSYVILIAGGKICYDSDILRNLLLIIGWQTSLFLFRLKENTRQCNAALLWAVVEPGWLRLCFRNSMPFNRYISIEFPWTQAVQSPCSIQCELYSLYLHIVNVYVMLVTLWAASLNDDVTIGLDVTNLCILFQVLFFQL